MPITTLEATSISQTRCDGYCDCGENWGYFGHSKFEASYRCPTCNEVHDLMQCAAWPVSCIDCEVCGDTIECALSPVEGVSFR
jgi:hypothetical protein